VQRLQRALLLVLAAAGAVLALAAPAGAHAELVTSEPSAGATVDHLDRVVLRFGQAVEVQGAHLWLVDDSGSVPLVAQHLDGDRTALVATVPPVAGGAYALGWHVVSADGDPVSGGIGFTFQPVGMPPAPPAIPGTEPTVAPLLDDHPSRLPAGAARILLDTALATLIGGLAFLATVWPQGADVAAPRRLLWGAAMAAAGASVLLPVLQHAAATGLSLPEAVSPAHLGGSLQYRFGRVAVARLGLLAVVAIVTSRLSRRGAQAARSRTWCAAAAAGALGLFETVVLLGHGGSSPFSDAARLLHTIGVSVWLGGLVMLFVVVLPRRRPDELAALLPRFSSLATAAVAVVLAGGTALALELAVDVTTLAASGYGRALLLKLVTVGALLVAAHRTRTWVRARVADVGTTATVIARWVGLELGLMAAVLALTSLLVSQTPPG
jgi:copper transport protein